MELKESDNYVKDFIPTGSQDYTPLHFIYPDSEGRTDPDFFESVGSGIKYQWMPITNAIQEQRLFSDVDYDNEFDFRKTVQDNDDYVFADELSRAKNLDHYNYIKQNLQAIQQNRNVYERAGIGAAIVAGVVDPLNIAFFHPVFNIGVRAAWAAKSAFGVAKESAKVGAIFGIGSELLRAPFDPFNTPQETITNIAGNTVFSGLLGGGARGIANRFGKIQTKFKGKKNPNPKTKDIEKIEKSFEKGPINSSLKEETIDRYAFTNYLLPSRRIQLFKYDGKQAPDYVKDFHLNIAYNGSVPIKGRAIQSVDMMQNIHSSKGLQLEKQLREIYMNDLMKSKGSGQVMGIDVVSPYVKYQNAFGKTPETFYQNSIDGNQKFPTPKEFEDEIINLNILMSDEKWKAQNYAQLPEYKKEGIRRVEAYIKYFDQLAQDTGVFQTNASIKKELPKLQQELDAYDVKIKNEKDPVFRNILAINRKKLNDQINFLEEYSPTRNNYRFPLYYDKVRINEDPKAAEELVEIFANHFLEEKKFTRWTGQGYETFEVLSINQARKFARETVETIKDVGDDPYGYAKPFSIGKSKHIMMRTTNIPEYKVKDFIIKDIGVLSRYAQMMSFRSEYARKFGDDSFDYILDRLEEQMVLDKYTPKQIAEIKADLIADYQRVAGQMTRDPERMDNTFVRISKKFAGMSYLTSAGITSLTETVAMPVLEHGLGRVLVSAFRAVDGNFDRMKANAKDLQHSLEGLELQKNNAQQRLLNEMLRPNQVGKIERSIDSLENFFYKANGLALVTQVGKLIDAAIRIPKFYKQIKNYDSLDEFDVIELQRYGIDRKTAQDLLDGGAWQFTDTEMPLLNLSEWKVDTKQQRALKSKMMTYLNSASRNTIMHATAFDRPTFADGFVFKKWKPYMRRFGIEPDPQASVGKQADGSYRYPIARIESGVMAFPFQFYNFAFAANQRITRAMFDPNKKHRLSGVIALLGMAYITLAMRKPSWWFEDKDYPELTTRLLDYSGVMGIYSDLAYKGVEAAIASGLHNPDTSWLKGRYNASGWDIAFGVAGATPSMYREWILGANELLNDKTEEGLKRVSYNFPYLGLLGLDDDLRALGGSRY